MQFYTDNYIPKGRSRGLEGVLELVLKGSFFFVGGGGGGLCSLTRVYEL